MEALRDDFPAAEADLNRARELSAADATRRCAACGACKLCTRDAAEAADADGDGVLEEWEMGSWYCAACYEAHYGRKPAPGEAQRLAAAHDELLRARARMREADAALNA